MFISQRLKSQKEGFHDKIAKLGRAKNLYHQWKRTFEANDILRCWSIALLLTIGLYQVFFWHGWGFVLNSRLIDVDEGYFTVDFAC